MKTLDSEGDLRAEVMLALLERVVPPVFGGQAVHRKEMIALAVAARMLKPHPPAVERHNLAFLAQAHNPRQHMKVWKGLAHEERISDHERMMRCARWYDWWQEVERRKQQK